MSFKMFFYKKHSHLCIYNTRYHKIDSRFLQEENTDIWSWRPWSNPEATSLYYHTPSIHISTLLSIPLQGLLVNLCNGIRQFWARKKMEVDRNDNSLQLEKKRRKENKSIHSINTVDRVSWNILALWMFFIQWCV